MMTKEQFNREIRYGAAMSAARAMLSKGIIRDRDYRKIDTILRRKYLPIIGSLQADLIAEKT